MTSSCSGKSQRNSARAKAHAQKRTIKILQERTLKCKSAHAKAHAQKRTRKSARAKAHAHTPGGARQQSARQEGAEVEPSHACTAIANPTGSVNSMMSDVERTRECCLPAPSIQQPQQPSGRHQRREEPAETWSWRSQLRELAPACRVESAYAARQQLT